jgi:hypothetical protein
VQPAASLGILASGKQERAEGEEVFVARLLCGVPLDDASRCIA